MARRVICISRTTGGGGETVGRAVAERLEFSYLDEEIITAAATRAGLDREDVADVERRKSAIERFLEALDETGGAAAGAYFAFVPSAGESTTLTTEDVRALIRETIAEVATRGSAVIVAHAASYALGSRDDVLRVLVTASEETRVRRCAAEQGLDAKRAAQAIKDSDASRADYLKQFYAIAEAPTHYDLVVNTDVLTPEEAAAVVVQAARS